MTKAQPRERHLIRGQSYCAHTIPPFGEGHLGVAAIDNLLRCDGRIRDGHGTNMREDRRPRHALCHVNAATLGTPSSHDLRNPLSTIRMSASLMLDEELIFAPNAETQNSISAAVSRQNNVGLPRMRPAAERSCLQSS